MPADKAAAGIGIAPGVAAVKSCRAPRGCESYPFRLFSRQTGVAYVITSYSIHYTKLYELSVQGKKVRLPLSQLQQYTPRRFAEKKAGAGKIRSRVERDSFSPRLLLVGKRADEALVVLDRFLDDALLHGAREVEIVHGSGTGILP